MSTVQQTPGPQGQPKRGLNLSRFVNSPYLLLLAPLLIGGFYLVLNPRYIILAMNYPFSAAFILAIPVCVFAVKFVFTFFSVIEKWIRLQFERARGANRGQFLEFVIVVFMFVSICEAGPFFNEVQGRILWGALGYITVFAFDLVAVVCMRSRAKMVRKGHDKKAFVYEVGVWLCALASVYANLRSALVNLAAAKNGTDWLSSLAPLVGVAFPVMIIFLSYATDADDDVDDPEIYKRDQERRVAFLRAKREIAAQVLEETINLNSLQQREFFLQSWFFTKAKMHTVREVVTKQVHAALTPDISLLKRELLQKENQINDLAKQCDDIQRVAQEMHLEEERQRQQQLDHMRQELIEQCEHSLREISMQHEQEIARLTEQFMDAVTTANIRPQSSPYTDLQEVANGRQSAKLMEAIDEPLLALDEQMKELIIQYPIVERWLSTGVRSITIEDVIKGTGHSPQLVRRREKDGTFRKTKREGFYRLDSVLAWLKSAPLPKAKEASIGVDTSLISTEIIAGSESQNGHHGGDDEVEKLVNVVAS